MPIMLNNVNIIGHSKNLKSKILTEDGIKTSRLDTNKTGFILANDQDLSEVIPKLNEISIESQGFGNIISDINIDISDNKLTIKYNKSNIIVSHCTYCSPSTYCTYCTVAYCSYCTYCVWCTQC